MLPGLGCNFPNCICPFHIPSHESMVSSRNIGSDSHLHIFGDEKSSKVPVGRQRIHEQID